ncbi:TetR/AcrR family transcriptional regulator [Citricoccus alkalitolerans]|uniref:TetR/AcrR family transcriptional regulator n=2 Tax=Citricoccus TaxID=169133 RepID=A0ABV8XY99_9MICC
MTATWRATQKANRRTALMESAARLFAERGFAAVSTTELGEAVGMSGPALYKHFASKDALLAEILVDASERLLAGCRAILAEAESEDRVTDPAQTLERLVRFHLEFATTDPDVIRIQDRELPSLAPKDNQSVRRLQREYVQLWDAVLSGLRPELDDGERQVRLLGTFGLLNSTPHSAGPTPIRATRTADGQHAGDILAGMALRSLTGGEPLHQTGGHTGQTGTPRAPAPASLDHHGASA